MEKNSNGVSPKKEKSKQRIEESLEKLTDESSTKEERDQAYNDYVKEVTPTHNLWANMGKAFLLGGVICLAGQIITNFGKNMFDLDQDIAGSWCSLILVLISVILTSCNVYPSFANWGGAGALVPITGFANGVCAPAIEFGAEGEVFGKGTRIFFIAGPVILYGIFSSWVLGFGYWIGKMWGWW